MKIGKGQITEGIVRPIQEKFWSLEEKKADKYLGILETDTIKQVRYERKKKKEFLCWMRKLFKIMLCSSNLIKGINTWAVLLVRYFRPFLKWTKEEVRQMNQWTRKLMTMHKALHPRDDIERLYVSKKEEGRGLTNIEESMDALYGDS